MSSDLVITEVSVDQYAPIDVLSDEVPMSPRTPGGRRPRHHSKPSNVGRALSKPIVNAPSEQVASMRTLRTSQGSMSPETMLSERGHLVGYMATLSSIEMAALSRIDLETRLGSKDSPAAPTQSAPSELRPVVRRSHLAGVFCMIAATAYWLATLALSHSSEFWPVLHNACVAFAFCCVFDFLTHIFKPQLQNHHVYVYACVVILQDLVFVVSFITGDFVWMWRPTYLGCHLYCMCILAAVPEKLFVMFRIFFTAHQTIHLTITGCWNIPKAEPCNHYLLLYVMLSLSSDIYVHVFNVFRLGRDRFLQGAVLAPLQVLVFVVERLHRGTAFVLLFALSAGLLTVTEVVVVSTWSLFDLLDSAFQARSILYSKKRRRRAHNDTRVKQGFNEMKSPKAVFASKPSSSSTCISFGSWNSKLGDDNSLAPTPFTPPNGALLSLFGESSFKKWVQAELSPREIQKLNRKRLESLGALRLLQIRGAMSTSLCGTQASVSVVNFLEHIHGLGMYDFSLMSVVCGHICGGAVVCLHGDDRQWRELREEIEEIQQVYCYASTELGHGCNLKAIFTTADFDLIADEWVLRTPDVLALKYWVGNLTYVGDIVMVLALLRIGDRDYGHHWFRVPLWSDRTRTRRFPGVVVSDLGVKSGCNGLGNGSLELDSVRVPRSALMQRFAQVDRQGNYCSPLERPERFWRCAQTFAVERLCVTTGAIGSAKMALYVALRYAMRKDMNGDALLAYSLHRRRLFPRVARIFSVKILTDALGHFAQCNFDQKSFDVVGKTMHSLACLAKTFGCCDALEAAREARECCGGHTFAAASELGMIRNDLDVAVTCDGDNSYLAFDVVRCALKSVTSDWPTWKKLSGPPRPSAAPLKCRMALEPKLMLTKLYDLFVYREEAMLWHLARELRGAPDKFECFGARGAEVRETARAVYDRICVESWLRRVFLSPLMDSLGLLDALCRLELSATWLMTDGVLSANSSRAMTKMIVGLCDDLTISVCEVLAAMEVPSEMVEESPLAHADYCWRLSNLTHGDTLCNAFFLV